MTMRPSFRFMLAAMTAALLIGGCAALEGTEEEDVYAEQPVETLYNDALSALKAGEYTDAVTGFNEVDRQHPYSIWAARARLSAAYAHYLNGEYDEAVIALDLFIDLHPGNPDIAYAYYLRAICYYEQITDVKRDQRITELALQALDDVVRRFPDSEYARDGALKIDLTRDHLAGKDMVIGRYYQRKDEYLAAINRFRNVIAQYQTTTHVPEALHRLVESYLALGLEGEAAKTASVLGYNFPGSEWYKDSYALLTVPREAEEEEEAASGDSDEGSDVIPTEFAEPAVDMDELVDGEDGKLPESETQKTLLRRIWDWAF